MQETAFLYIPVGQYRTWPTAAYQETVRQYRAVLICTTHLRRGVPIRTRVDHEPRVDPRQLLRQAAAVPGGTVSKTARAVQMEV
eukprot:1232747-Rhodomonas_salina.1